MSTKSYRECDCPATKFGALICKSRPGICRMRRQSMEAATGTLSSSVIHDEIQLAPKRPNIHKMNLFDKRTWNEMTIQRVPGGWIFAEVQRTTFVPYNDEFRLENL